MQKKPFKSKTINSALIVIVIAILSLFGVGEKDMGSTIDTMTNGQGTENIKEIITILAGAGVIYGRYRVKEKDDE